MSSGNKLYTGLVMVTTLLTAASTSQRGMVRVEIGDHKRHIDLKHYSDYVVELLNSFRRMELANHAANLRRLTWSPDLAQAAAVQATSCKVDYLSRKYGYNYASTNSQATPPSGDTLSLLIKALCFEWAKEAYDIFKPCSGSCNNFTQMIWAETRQVGCSLHDCSYLALRNKRGWLQDVLFFVCMYSDKGNVHGKAPALFGLKPCSMCGASELCDFGLCYAGDRCDDSPETEHDCESWASRGLCVKNARWMKQHCRKSCKVCGTACHDEKGERYCRIHKARSGCVTGHDFSKVNCMKTCGFCLPDKH